MVLVSSGVLVDGLPGEDGDVFLLSELPVLEHGVGSDESQGKDSEGDDDNHGGSCLLFNSEEMTEAR